MDQPVSKLALQGLHAEAAVAAKALATALEGNVALKYLDLSGTTTLVPEWLRPMVRHASSRSSSCASIPMAGENHFHRLTISYLESCGVAVQREHSLRPRWAFADRYHHSSQLLNLSPTTRGVDGSSLNNKKYIYMFIFIGQVRGHMFASHCRLGYKALA